MTRFVDAPNVASLPPCNLSMITKPVEMQELHDSLLRLLSESSSPSANYPAMPPKLEWLPTRTLRVLIDLAQF